MSTVVYDILYLWDHPSSRQLQFHSIELLLVWLQVDANGFKIGTCTSIEARDLTLFHGKVERSSAAISVRSIGSHISGKCELRYARSSTVLSDVSRDCSEVFLVKKFDLQWDRVRLDY